MTKRKILEKARKKEKWDLKGRKQTSGLFIPMSMFLPLPHAVPRPGEKGVRRRWTRLTHGGWIRHLTVHSEADWGPGGSQGGLNNSDRRRKVAIKKSRDKAKKQQNKNKNKHTKETKYDRS